MKILCATQNPGKQQEFRQILADDSIELAFPQDYDRVADLDPDETGDSFQANALIKALAFGQATGLVTIADDSGLEVNSLNGQPGIHSKRLAPGSDHDRNLKLLELLADQPDRSARFISIICLYDPETQEHQFFEGVVTGQIAAEEAGRDGFGYDPLFIPDGYDQTFGQLGDQVKNTISHRRRALIKLHNYLLAETS